MHSLEQLLLILSERIRHETGNKELADAALTLADASHCYEPTTSVEESLAEMKDVWSRRYEDLMVGSDAALLVQGRAQGPVIKDKDQLR